MTSKKRFVFGMILFSLLAGGAFLFRLYRQPLGPALELPASTQLAPTLTALPSVTTPAESATTEVPVAATQTSPPQPLCGGPAVMNILAVGSDSRGQHYLYGLADVIRLVRVDFVNSRVTILEVPRDLWVQIPDISDHYNITQGKLNQAYLYGNKGLGYFDGPGEGPGLLARTLNLNFGAQPDHYLAVNMRTFENIVDAIGGLEVYLPYEISVKSKDNPKGFGIPAGQHHIDGETALWIARIRQYSTFSRAENQNIVMCALRKKLLSPAVVPAIPEMVRSFQKYVQTDLSPEQINQLACLAQQMHGTDVVFASFPIKLFKAAKTFDPQLGTTTTTADADFTVLRDYIDRFQQGTWPDPDLFINTTPSPDATDLEFACDD
ncbi:MAG TPA: LCP family protein [Anaerolineales bacterium]|nr:LCP family protein [Anaerolineales bacterium]